MTNETGLRLRQIRKDVGLTQKEFAEKLGVSFRTYTRYETESVNIPNSALEELAILGYSMDWLITGKGEMRVRDVEFVPDGDYPMPDYENEGIIKDPGLDQLLSPANRGKFLITEEEAHELRGLMFRRKSQTTLQQWVSLLYMLREMKED